MRAPKRGDRCEYAEFSPKAMKKLRPCQVRHLEGTPPGLLMTVTQDGAAALMCGRHAPMFTKHGSVRRQKPKVVDAAQELLV